MQVNIQKSCGKNCKKSNCKRCNEPKPDLNGYCETCMTRISEKIDEKIPERYKNTLDIYFTQASLLRGKSVFITGKTGSGKTALAYAIIEAELLFDKNCKPVCYPELIDKLRYEGFNNIHYEKMRIAEFQGALLLDDVGAETASEFNRETLYMIINSRYQCNRQTIITSNMSLDQIAEIDDRIASRIAEMCEVIEMEDKDYRVISA